MKTNLGSGNVYHDLGISDAEVRYIKTHLAISIYKYLKRENLTQVEAANRIGVDQSKISKICRGKVENFSIDRLIFFAEKLGGRTTISVFFPGE